MKKELPYFEIEGSYGGNQDWFSSFMMRLGGCGAETACDTCIYLDLYQGTHLYPLDIHHLTTVDYVAFSDVMKPYLHPRMSGIYKLSMYLDGFGAYLKEHGSTLQLTGLEGTESAQIAAEAVIRQIDSDYPVPCLCLNHADSRFKEYQWHWFILNGYDNTGDTLLVKAVTYSSYEWLPLEALWQSGKMPKGGLILIENGQ